MTHTNDDEAMARLAALSAKLRSQDPIPSRSEIAAEIDSIREILDRREAVPVAWGESYDGGAFFSTVSLTKTKHHTYPLYAHPPQPSASVVEALEAMLHAVCGETGFAACVRHDSGSAYPWPALDAAEEKARSALRALKGDDSNG